LRQGNGGDSLKLNLATYDALQLMVVLAPENETRSSYYLSSMTGISPSLTCKLLRILSKSNLLDSERGLSGGYRLAKPAKEISLYEVINVMQGFSFTSCFSKKSDQPSAVSPDDPLPERLMSVQTQVGFLLKNITLNDLCEKNENQVLLEKVV